MFKSLPTVLLFSLWMLVTGLNCGGSGGNIKSTKELDHLVLSFLNECSKRGLTNDFSGDSFVIGFGKVRSKAASCRPNSYPKLITIDSLTWRILSPPLQEMLVYHELAHCLLGKKHNNEVFKFGECKSWMRENDSTCTINTINSVWRTYYTNELFEGEAVSIPIWYDTTQDVEFNEESRIVHPEIITTKANSLVFDSVFINSRSNWIIRFKFMDPENLHGSLGVAIDEYEVQFSSYTDLSQKNYKPIFNRSITIQQYDYLRQVTIVSWDTLRRVGKKTDLSIKRTGDAILVYFEKDLKLCIPIIKDNIKLSGYVSFEEKDGHSIDIYK